MPLETSPRLNSSKTDCAGSTSVSIIIACYNHAHFLGEAIESVLAQSYLHFEIVVVDDGSTDNTSEVAARYPGVRCIRQDNQGLAAARNAGLGWTNGKYLVFLDADDRLLPEALERGLECFEAHPDCALVAGHYRLIEANGALHELPPHRVGGEYYADLLRRNYIAMHATVMYRRDVFYRVGTFNTSLRACEDYDLYLRIARQFPLHCHEQVVAEYRQHGANMTQNPALMLECALTVLRSQWPVVRGNPRYEEAYRAGMKFWQGYYGAQSAAQKDKLSVVEIVNVTLCEMPDERLWGRNLEAPQVGHHTSGHALELVGWVLGRQAPVLAVEVVVEGRVLRHDAIDVHRLDVAAHYPDVVGGEKSGFHTWVALTGIADQEFLIQAVLQDHNRVPLARIGARRRWRESVDGSTAPLVSVIIPCFNQAHYLAEAIESVLAQSYPNFEILVVDDGSSDNTAEVAGQYPAVRCIWQENRGLGTARNTGLEHSRGEYVLFLDADDRLLANALGVGLAAFEAHPDCALVAGHYRVIGVNGVLIEEPPPNLVQSDHYAELLRRNCIRVPATVLYRRAVFACIGGFDTAVSPCADYDVYLRVARRFPIYCHGSAVAEYRQHAGSMTGNPALMLKSVLRVLHSQREEIRRNPKYKKAYKIGRRVWQDYYGEQLVTNIRTQLKQHRCKQALIGMLPLLQNYPRGLISLVFNYSLHGRIREIVATALQPKATIIVASAGDNKRWKLSAHRILHFALLKNGEEANSHAANSAEYICHLEQLRGQGADFLLVPSTSFWLLHHYSEFRLHLEAQYRRVWNDERCIIYRLSGPGPGQLVGDLEDLVVCPACKGELHFSASAIRCTSCKVSFAQLGNNVIDLLPRDRLADEATRWGERQQEMETWYKDLITNPRRAHDCFVHDYSPIASILATLSGMVLDVGGGIGLVRHYLPRGTEYIVIDPSLQWLTAEWSSLSEHFPCLKNLPNFVRGIGEYLPFPARRFDTVLACWSLNHASNPQQVFREVWRVLRPRGRFLIILEDMVTDENPGDQPFHFSHETLGLEHLNGAQSLSRFNDPAAPLQSDHIRILESDIAAWASEIFEITQRSWVGQYLTFELTKIQSTEQLTRARAW